MKRVKRNVSNIIFNLTKELTGKRVIQVYKQMILPLLNYALFIFLSLFKDDNYELQKIQNDLL